MILAEAWIFEFYLPIPTFHVIIVMHFSSIYILNSKRHYSAALYNIYSFIFMHTFTLSGFFSFHFVFYISIQDHVSSTRRTSFHYSFPEGLLATNSLGFHLLQNIFISLSFWRIFYWARILDHLLFFFHCFKDVTTLSSGLHHFCWEVSCHFYGCSLEDNVFFPFWLLPRFSVSGFQQFYYDMPICGFLCVSLAWGSLNFLNMGIDFCKIWKMLIQYFFEYWFSLISFSFPLLLKL